MQRAKHKKHRAKRMLVQGFPTKINLIFNRDFQSRDKEKGYKKNCLHV